MAETSPFNTEFENDRERLSNLEDSRKAMLYMLEDLNRSAKELRDSEERYRTLAEAAQDVIVVITPDGHIQYINSFGASRQGRRPEEIIGRSLEEFFPQDIAEQQKQAIKEVIETGKDVYHELKIPFPDMERWEEAHLAPIRDEGGNIYAILGIVREITERKKAEEEIRRNVQRLTALRTIDMAITGSLDLRVTLNVILDQVTVQLGVDAADIVLFNPRSQTLEYRAGRGFRTTALQHTHLRLGEGYAGQAALERRIVSVPNLGEEKMMFRQAQLLPQEGFVAYYAAPLIAKGEAKGVLEIFHRTPLKVEQEWLNFLEALATQAAIAVDNAMLFEDIQLSHREMIVAYDATIEGWTRALDLRDKETEGHTERVTELTMRLARMAGIGGEDLVHVRRGTLLHDIGKIGIPDAILLKPGKLTDEEWVIMRKHPEYAFGMLSLIAYLRPAMDIPYCHHERWDGTGYPRGLKGDEIPLSARLFAMVDVWDALRSDRPYRPSWPKEKVMEHISQGGGTHFDPSLIPVFLEMVREL